MSEGPKVVIDGQEYPLPDLGSIDMEQALVIEKYTGLSLEQLAEVDTTKSSIVAAFCHLALREANPRRTFSQIESVVKRIKLAELNFTEAEEDEENPPLSTQSETGSVSQPSGLTSDVPSDVTPEPLPLRTGTLA